MRLLHVVPTYLPAVRYGGPIFAVHGLAKALVAAGHEVHVFTTNVDGPVDSDVPLDQPVIRDGVTVHYFPASFRRLYYAPELGRRLRSEMGDFDVVHLHSVFLYPTAAGAHAAKRHGVPYVLSPRGMLVRDLIGAKSAILKGTWIAGFERRNLRGAATIHLTSAREKAALADLGLDLAPTAIIPNGVEDRPRSDGIASGAGVGRFDVLALGRINWKKGLDVLIRSLARLPGVTAVFAGNDEDGYAPYLRNLAHECGVADRVTFLIHRVGDEEKADLFRSARVVAVPSISENFGNVVAEALLHEKPVVTTDGVGAGEIVEASRAGMVCRFDATDLADALGRTLALDDDELRRKGVAGRRYVRQVLSWSRIGDQFTELYESVAAARSLGALATGVA